MIIYYAPLVLVPSRLYRIDINAITRSKWMRPPIAYIINPMIHPITIITAITYRRIFIFKISRVSNDIFSKYFEKGY